MFSTRRTPIDGILLAETRWRSFYLAWSGQLLSALGGPFQAVAIGVWALSAGHGADGLSRVLALSTVAQLLGSLSAGPLIDRIGPATAILAADISRLILSGLVAGCIAGNRWPLVLLLVSAGGAANGVFRPALRSLPPAFLESHQLARANGLLQASDACGMLVGALVGGLVTTTIGPAYAVLINALSYGLGVIGMMTTLRLHPGTVRRVSVREPPLRVAGAGIRFALTSRWLLVLIGVDAVMDLTTAGQLSVGLPAVAQQQQGGVSLGLMLAAFGAGLLAGSAIAPQLIRARLAASGPAVSLLHLAQAPFFALIPVSSAAGASGCLAAIGLFNGVAGVSYYSLLQRRTPAELLGRVMAMLAVAALVLQPAGQLLSGWLIEAGLLTASFVAAAILMAAAALGSLASPTLRRLR